MNKLSKNKSPEKPMDSQKSQILNELLLRQIQVPSGVRSKFLLGGGEQAWWMGRGGNSERCLQWGVGVIKESFQKHLKIGSR